MKNTKDRILRAGVKLAKRVGYQAVDAAELANVVGISRTNLTYYVGNVAEMRRAILDKAVEIGAIAVIVQGLATGVLKMHKLSPEQRRIIRMRLRKLS